jgi:2-haloacid dehalogenase
MLTARAGRAPDAVVFDLGGVLIDWDPRHLYRPLFAERDEMEYFLARICTAQWHRAHDLGEDVTESCQRLARQHPGYAGLIMAWAERGEEMAAGSLDDTVQILAELKSAGTRCYALSNMEPDAFAVRRDRFPFLEWFDGCVISGLEGVAKPDRRIFEILLERYRLEPREVLFVDDLAGNVEAASALGIHAVHFKSAGELRRQLRSFGYNLVKPLR